MLIEYTAHEYVGLYIYIYICYDPGQQHECFQPYVHSSHYILKIQIYLHAA